MLKQGRIKTTLQCRVSSIFWFSFRQLLGRWCDGSVVLVYCLVFRQCSMIISCKIRTTHHHNWIVLALDLFKGEKLPIWGIMLFRGDCGFFDLECWWWWFWLLLLGPLARPLATSTVACWPPRPAGCFLLSWPPACLTKTGCGPGATGGCGRGPKIQQKINYIRTLMWT